MCGAELRRRHSNGSEAFFVRACGWVGFGWVSEISHQTKNSFKVSLVQFKIISYCMNQQLVQPVTAYIDNRTPMDEQTLESACKLLQNTGKVLDQARFVVRANH